MIGLGATYSLSAIEPLFQLTMVTAVVRQKYVVGSHIYVAAGSYLDGEPQLIAKTTRVCVVSPRLM